MKTEKNIGFLFFIIGFLLPFSVLATNSIKIQVYAKDNLIIKDAKVIANGQKIKYNPSKSSYFISNYTGTNEVFIVVSHSKYLKKEKHYKIIQNSKESKIVVYLFQRRDDYFISNNDSVPFKKVNNRICVWLKRNYSDSISFRLLLDSLSLKEDRSQNLIASNTGNFCILKKKGFLKTKRFNEFDNSILKKLRENNMVINAGPIVNQGIVSGKISLKVNAEKRDIVFSKLIEMGFENKGFNKFNNEYDFKANNLLGYRLIEILNELLEEGDIVAYNMEICGRSKIY